MGDEAPKQSWWQTLPGILTGVTAIITALGGLIVAINQTHWFSRDSPYATPAAVAAAGDPVAAAALEQTVAPAGSSGSVTLPAARDYALGTAVFTVLGATLAQRNSEASTLTLHVRLTNNERYDANFWDSEFRLLVDGVPHAPISGLNELVAGNAAGDGDVTFIVPRTQREVQLRILFADEQTDVPLTLAHPG